MEQTFHPFPKLPLEIRWQVWAEFTPSGDDPSSLFIFTRRCVRHLYCNSNEDVVIENNTPTVQITLPIIYHVSREARDAVVYWVEKHGYSLHLSHETGKTILVRVWDERKDVLYVPPRKWDDFQFILDENIRLRTLSVSHLAISAKTAQMNAGELAEMRNYLPHLKTVSIIWGKQPQARIKRTHRRAWDQNQHVEWQPLAQARWELGLETAVMGTIFSYDELIDIEVNVSSYMDMIIDEYQGSMEAWKPETGHLEAVIPVFRAMTALQR